MEVQTQSFPHPFYSKRKSSGLLVWRKKVIELQRTKSELFFCTIYWWAGHRKWGQRTNLSFPLLHPRSLAYRQIPKMAMFQRSHLFQGPSFWCIHLGLSGGCKSFSGQQALIRPQNGGTWKWSISIRTCSTPMISKTTVAKPAIPTWVARNL